MKRAIILMLVGVIAACLLISCGEVPTEMTTGAAETTAATPQKEETLYTTEDTTETTTVETTVPQVETTEKTTAVISSAETTMQEATTSWATGTTYETLPEFEGFTEFDGPGRDTFWQGKADIAASNFEGCVGAIFRIIGVKDPSYYGRAVLYYAQVIDIYGEISADSSIIYCLGYKGSYDKTLYGRPPLEIGKDYLYLIEAGFSNVTRMEKFEYMPLVQMGLMMPVVQDGDKTYVYGYGVDFGNLECAIEITDEEENQIYKVGKHDAIITKLKDIGVRLPTFDYKCELEEMLREIDIID